MKILDLIRLPASIHDTRLLMAEGRCAHTTLWFSSHGLITGCSMHESPFYNLADRLNCKYDYATQMRGLLLSIGFTNGAEHFLCMERSCILITHLVCIKAD